MKTLGTTVDGNYLVEMTPDEHWSFVKLEASINGRGIEFLSYPRQTLSGKNLAPIFTALDDLSDARISINRLKEYINFLDGALGKAK
jgi:hypothetical protein